MSSRPGRPGQPGRPGLIATDLDGTLLRSDGTLSDATRRVLAAVEEAGVPVVFVTGRPVRWMESLWEVVGAHGLAIVSNGAVLYDVAERAVRRVDGLHHASGLDLVERLRGVVLALCKEPPLIKPDQCEVLVDAYNENQAAFAIVNQVVP